MLFSDYTACKCAVFISLVQSIVRLTWSIWGTSVYVCNHIPQKKTVGFLIYVTYFYNQKCVKVLYVEDLAEAFSIKDNKTVLELPLTSTPADYTNTVLLVLVFFDICWVFAAICLLAAVYFRMKHLHSLILYIPWLFISGVLLIIEFIISIGYSLNIHSTRGFQNWYEFVGGKNQSIVKEFASEISPRLTQIPSILMTLAFSRFVIIWLLNGYLFFRITHAFLNSVLIYKNAENPTSEVNQDQSFETIGPQSFETISPQSFETITPQSFETITPQSFETISSQSFETIRSHNPGRSSNLQIQQQSERQRNNSTWSIRKEAEEKRFQFQYDTDEEDEEVEHRHHKKTNKPKPSNVDKQFSSQNLAVAEYEGDRSNSPSPAPFRKENPVFKFSNV